MGWTHDYSDAARNRRSAAGLSSHQRGAPQLRDTDPRLGIPRILRRRARWVSARLRHSRP
ncbi:MULTISPECIES: hypothetical protein [Streptomyces]|uniref:hypothetical protein n=1 Tax=Streptomyces TaxID=1883 RepID=UPI000998E6CA|nr:MULTISPECIES: hypothetical protein [Streptomyces]MBP5862157.1 hypothetical protein [Streptomyces sp. LBUM 1484]MBP5868890.1 hypothetical protein [Streptomyces sp. LBUM 1485]MBP5907400.1 hypothetical protein [Streptomyces sp. LBUM 1478]MBP5929716.1 hypothetical protein [Streptomyces sp. LBUM 1479]MBP5877363.1 hypothetical protein [Streptomyces sp. LBUM 1477]